MDVLSLCEDRSPRTGNGVPFDMVRLHRHYTAQMKIKLRGPQPSSSTATTTNGRSGVMAQDRTTLPLAIRA
jgi:hypothetical protein